MTAIEQAPDLAIDAFTRGYCFTRSVTHPYLRERVGDLWRLYDEPRTRGTRREEFVSHGVPPAEVHRLASKHARSHYCLCALFGPDEDGEALKEGFKALGYRLGHTEFMMVHPLTRIPRVPAPLPIARVTTQEMADRLAKAAGARQLLPEHLAKDAPIRCYVALDGDEPVGWVSSVVTGDATWCHNMFVHPDHRRRGIARALMCRMLRDDRKGGSQAGVLLASHAGARLYPVVGYREIGTLLVLTPKRKRA